MKLKNFVVAMCAATMMIAGATVASAVSEVKVEVDSVTDTQAVVNLYATATEADYKTLTLNVKLMDNGVDVSKTYFKTATVDNYATASNASQAMLNASTKMIMVVCSDSFGTLTWGSDNPDLVATFTIDLNKPLTDGLTLDITKATFSTMTNSKAVNVETLTGATVSVTPPGPTTETITATPVVIADPEAFLQEGEMLDDDYVAADAYYVTKAFTSGQTAYWSASWDGTPMKKEATLANLAGKTKLGIVFDVDATISNVALNVVTQ